MQLVGQFFAKGQRAAGREEYDCGPLSASFPAALLSSVVARSQRTGDIVVIEQDGVPVVEAAGVAALNLTDEQRQGTISVSARDGSLSTCFVVFDGRPWFVGAVELFEQASSSQLTFAVGAAGASTDVDRRATDEVVEVSVSLGGQPTTANFDPNRRLWQVTVTDASTASPLRLEARIVNGPVLGELTQTLELVTDPPIPQVTWVGDRRVEGAGRIAGKLRVIPQAATGGAAARQWARRASHVDADELDGPRERDETVSRMMTSAV